MARLITTYEEWVYCSNCERITLIEEIDADTVLCPECLEGRNEV